MYSLTHSLAKTVFAAIALFGVVGAQAQSPSASASPVSFTPGTIWDRPNLSDRTGENLNTCLLCRYSFLATNVAFVAAVKDLAAAWDVINVQQSQHPVYRNHRAVAVAFIDLLTQYRVAANYFGVRDPLTFKREWLEVIWPASDRLVRDLLAQGRNPGSEMKVYRFDKNQKIFLAGDTGGLLNTFASLMTPTSAYAGQGLEGIHCDLEERPIKCSNQSGLYYSKIECGPNGVLPREFTTTEETRDTDQVQVCDPLGNIRENLKIIIKETKSFDECRIVNDVGLVTFWAPLRKRVESYRNSQLLKDIIEERRSKVAYGVLLECKFTDELKNSTLIPTYNCYNGSPSIPCGNAFPENPQMCCTPTHDFNYESISSWGVID